MACGPFYFRAIITNQDAVVALARAVELVVEAAEDLPWRDDLGEALEQLRYATEHLTVRQSPCR